MNRRSAKVSRRDLLKSAAVAGAGLGLASIQTRAATPAETEASLLAPPPAIADSVMGLKFEPRETVRVAIIGTGSRGTGMLSEFLAVKNVQITALCDVARDFTVQAKEIVEKAGQKTPAIYHNGEHDFENLCKRDDIDFIYIATPWDWHVPMAVAGMNSGKHVGVEVPAAVTVEGCWELVNTSEKTRRHCVIMENCCYGWSEMTILNMIRAGLFGEVLHGECAYNHDLRFIVNENRSEGLWRRLPHITRDGNLYPTHGLGPVANYMNVNRGDKFEYLVSMSSPSVGLNEYREKTVPKGDLKWKEKYKCGDVNTSLIKTAQGRSIMLQHAVTVPHPYDRINLVQGSKGIFRDYPMRIYFDGQEGGEDFTGMDKFKAQYEHHLWKTTGELARQNGGHGGMDYIMVYRLMECLRKGLEPDMDVYDAAVWSAPGPLSDLSVARGSAPVPFPDFTRGKWTGNRAVLGG
jgi:hypothetical protein